MTRRLLIALSGMLALSACASVTEVPSPEKAGQLSTRIFDLAPFRRIEIDADVLLEIHQAERQSVVLHTEDDHFKALTVRVDNGTLFVRHKGHRHRHRNIALDIAVTGLEAISIEGAVDGRLHDIDAGHFRFALSGVGELAIDGRCEVGNFRISGVGDVDLGKFRCNRVSADISGIGDVTLTALEAVDIDISGIGDLTVGGNPQERHVDYSGIGSVSYSTEKTPPGSP